MASHTGTTEEPIKLDEKDKLKIQEHLIQAMLPEFEAHLDPSKILYRLNGLDDETKDKIVDISNRREAVRMLIESVQQQNIISEFIQALRIKKFYRFLDVLDDKKIENKQKTANEYCAFLVSLLQMDLIEEANINPIHLLPHLIQAEIISSEDAECIRCINDNMGRTKACIEFFKQMPRQKSDWPFEFFRALQKHSPAALLHLDIDMSVKETVYGNTSTDRVATDEGAGTAAREDLEENNFSDDEEKTDSKKSTQMDIYENGPELSMRAYQLELSEVAINGENTIICAPTGSGKTRIALYIVKNHLEESLPGKPKKIVFLARTTPLVNQQSKTFQKYLPAKYSNRILNVTGESDVSMQLHTVLVYTDILVLTPQILDNHLRDKKIKSLNEFSLVILDECHHTRKGEPYNNLMKKYLKAKKSGEKGLPQIIGLTASLGVEKATTTEEAMLSILKLCANLDVYKLSTVVVNKAELEKFVPVPDERLVELTGNRKDEAREEIHATMIKIESHLEEAAYELCDVEINSLLRKRPSGLDSQSYGQWAVKMKRAAMVIDTQTLENKKFARTVVVTARQLEVYNASLDIHDLVRLCDVLYYLEKNLRENSEKNKHSPVEADVSMYFRELKNKLRQLEQSDVNPNLLILSRTLINLRREKGADSLGIIFVRTRATCSAICEWMNRSEKQELNQLNAETFTGAGAHEDEGGMTQNEQDATISRFKSGATKLIIATSVAEEGLDIPECNIVLRYNHVGNEITTVQTRGRSRKKGGVSVLLGYSQILLREKLNVERSKMMNEAIIQVRNLDWADMNLRIGRFQKEAIEAEEIKEETERLKSINKIEGNFTLWCVKCKKLSIDSKYIRTINRSHHVIVDPNFMNKVDTRPNKSPPKSFDGIQITGKIHCKECHNYLGVMFKYSEIMFPAIKLEHYQLRNEEGCISLYKKWQEIPYKVMEIGIDDIRALTSKLLSDKEKLGAVASPEYDNNVPNYSTKENLSNYSTKENLSNNTAEKDEDETSVKTVI